MFIKTKKPTGLFIKLVSGEVAEQISIRDGRKMEILGKCTELGKNWQMSSVIRLRLLR